MRLPKDRPALMGIVNVTPDSFSDGGLHFGLQTAIDAGLRMLDHGADILDIGGESTRPGATPVDVAEELHRVIPVIEALSKRGSPISIDTMKAAVAAEALSAGAEIVNDVSGLRDPDMLAICVDRRSTLCVMHMLGTPQTMQISPKYEDVVGDVKSKLLELAHSATRAGLTAEQVWIDAGIGFGKNDEHNLALIRNLSQLVETGFPVLIGVSRKGFIGRILGSIDHPLSVDQRLEGTLALQAAAQIAGARIVRAHDVQASRRVIDMIAALGTFPSKETLDT